MSMKLTSQSLKILTLILQFKNSFAYEFPSLQELLIGRPRDLLADGVAFHVVEVSGGGAHCVEELPEGELPHQALLLDHLRAAAVHLRTGSKGSLVLRMENSLDQ